MHDYRRDSIATISDTAGQRRNEAVSKQGEAEYELWCISET